MVSFEKRPLEWIDVNPRFEGGSMSDHVRNAVAHIQRLEVDGAELFGRDSERFERWQRACKELEGHIRSLGVNRGRDLATSLREFIHSFEHATERMYQIVHGISDSAKSDMSVRQMLARFDLVYKLSTYAIIFSYIPDRIATSTLRTTINLTTGEQRREGEYIEPRVPKTYRHAARKIWERRSRA